MFVVYSLPRFLSTDEENTLPLYLIVQVTACMFIWMIVSSLLVVTPVLFALVGYEWRRARLTSKLPGVSIRASCRRLGG